jgi:hypothetical protein
LDTCATGEVQQAMSTSIAIKVIIADHFMTEVTSKSPGGHKATQRQFHLSKQRIACPTQPHQGCPMCKQTLQSVIYQPVDLRGMRS